MMWQVLCVASVVILQLAPSYGQNATLEIITLRNTSQCSIAMFQCGIKNLTSLRWFFDDTQIASYTHSSSAVIPMNVSNIYGDNGVHVVVTRAQFPTIPSDMFDGDSVLTTTTLSLTKLNVEQIQCGTNTIRSSPLSTASLNVQVSPTLSCSLSSSSEAVDVSLQFSSQPNVESYRVSVAPDPSSCSSDQVNPSSQTYTCPGLQLQEYTFEVSALPRDCLNQEGEPSVFTVQPQAPQIENGALMIIPTYNQDYGLEEIFVKWPQQPQSHISGKCSFSVLTYSILLMDNLNSIIETRIVNCSDTSCNTTFSEQNFKEYGSLRVSLSVSNGVGSSSGSITSVVSGSVADFFSITFMSSNCSTSFNCGSLGNIGNCGIRYKAESSDQNFSSPIETPLNSMRTLPLLEPSTMYSYILNVNINSSMTFRVRGIFDSEPFASRLTETNQGLIITGVIFFFLAAIIAVALCAVHIRTRKGFGFFLSWCSLAVGLVLIVVCVALWIAVCAVVIPQDDTCVSSWQSHRSSLIIAAFLFSLFAAIAIVACAIIFSISCCGLVDKLPCNGDVKQRGMEMSNVTEGQILVDEHAGIGKSVQMATAEKRDELRSTGEQESNRNVYAEVNRDSKSKTIVQNDQYNHLRDQNNPKKTEGSSGQVYSQLDSKEQKEEDYSPLNYEKESKPSSPLALMMEPVKNIYARLKQEILSNPADTDFSEESLKDIGDFCAEVNKKLKQLGCEESISTQEALSYLRKHDFKHDDAVEDVCKYYQGIKDFYSKVNQLLRELKCEKQITRDEALDYLKSHDFNHENTLEVIRRKFQRLSTERTPEEVTVLRQGLPPKTQPKPKVHHARPPDDQPQPEANTTDLDVNDLPPEKVKILSTFLTKANEVLAKRHKKSISTDKAWEFLKEQECDIDKAWAMFKKTLEGSSVDPEATKSSEELAIVHDNKEFRSKTQKNKHS